MMAGNKRRTAGGYGGGADRIPSRPKAKPAQRKAPAKKMAVKKAPARKMVMRPIAKAAADSAIESARKSMGKVATAASKAKYGLIGAGVSAIKRAVASKKLVKAKRQPLVKRQPPGGAYSTAGQRPKKKSR